MTNGEFRNSTSDIFYYYYEGIFFKQYIKHQQVLTWVSATVGSSVSGSDPVSIVFEISNEMMIGEDNTLIIVADRPIWNDVATSVSCTGILESVAHNGFTASTTSNTTLKGPTAKWFYNWDRKFQANLY